MWWSDVAFTVANGRSTPCFSPVSNAYSKVRGQLTASYTSAFNLVILGEFEGNLDSSVTQYFVVFNSKNYPQILSHFILSFYHMMFVIGFTSLHLFCDKAFFSFLSPCNFHFCRVGPLTFLTSTNFQKTAVGTCQYTCKCVNTELLL